MGRDCGDRRRVYRGLSTRFSGKNRSGAAIPVYMIGTYDYPHFGIDLLGDHDEKHNRAREEENRSHLTTQVGIQYFDSRAVPLGET